MGRHKKVVVEDSFNDVFGDFCSTVADNNGPYSEITEIKTANPCVDCGRYPLLHNMNFRNKEAHPKHFYVSCDCGQCDGEWYATAEDAIKAWNDANQGGVPRDPEKKDMTDFIKEMMSDFKITD